MGAGMQPPSATGGTNLYNFMLSPKPQSRGGMSQSVRCEFDILEISRKGLNEKKRKQWGGILVVELSADGG